MSATDIRTVSYRAPPARPLRLSLRPPARGRRVVDGGWWPRSRDPSAELPSLITALNVSHGVVTQITLNVDAWSPTPRRLSIDGRAVRLDWADTIDPHLIIATCGHEDRLNLLVVPPRATMRCAAAALATATDTTSALRASEILLRVSIPLSSSTKSEPPSESVWEDDGGRVAQTGNPPTSPLGSAP